MIYTSINQPVFPQTPCQAKRILDIGCGSAGLGQAVKQKFECKVTGITYSQNKASLVSQYNPDKLLLELHSNLTKEGSLIVALLNVLFFEQRWEFVKGNFKYTDGRVMDKTHFRFFDWETPYQLLK